MNSTFSLAPGFHAVVIGGAGDIGAAISNLFCELGATVTATGVNDADLARTLAQAARGLAARRRSTSPMTRRSQSLPGGTSASTRWSIAPAFSRATRNLRSRPS